MPIIKVNFKDEDGFAYKHPERSCSRCLEFPCIPEMEKLKGDFAKYGCLHYRDINVFECKTGK